MSNETYYTVELCPEQFVGTHSQQVNGVWVDTPIKNTFLLGQSQRKRLFWGQKSDDHHIVHRFHEDEIKSVVDRIKPAVASDMYLVVTKHTITKTAEVVQL